MARWVVPPLLTLNLSPLFPVAPLLARTSTPPLTWKNPLAKFHPVVPPLPPEMISVPPPDLVYWLLLLALLRRALSSSCAPVATLKLMLEAPEPRTSSTFGLTGLTPWTIAFSASG